MKSKSWALSLALLLCASTLTACSGDANTSTAASSATDDANTSTTSNAADAATTQPSDRHNERATDREWYLKIVDNIAVARAIVQFAGDAVQQGDMGTGSAIMERAEQSADAAVSASMETAPSGWDDVSTDLWSASKDLKAAIASLRSYMDEQRPSEAADVQDKIASSTASLQSGVTKARSHYVDLGGKSDDLPDGEEMMNATLAMLRTLQSNQ
jgi:hypothetical protein